MNQSQISGKLVFFNTKDGLRTSGFLLDSGGDDIIVFVHGMGGNFYKEGFIKEASDVLDEYSFFSFNTRGAEVVKSFKDSKGDRHLLGTAFEKFEECVQDIDGAVELLKSLGFDRIHLMGHSTGCQKILYYALNRKGIESLIHLAPADDYEIWKNYLGEDFERYVSIARDMVSKGEGDKLMVEMYKRTGDLWSAKRFLSFASRENWEARMFNYEDLSTFSEVKIPTFVALGREDQYFLRPVEWYAERLKNAYRGEKLKVEILPGDHSFHGYEELLFRKILDFLRDVK